MKTNQIFSNKSIRCGLFLLTGLFLGWLFFYPIMPSITTTDTVRSDTTAEQKTQWTCAMHPQIRLDEPGKCPICGMNLIPLQNTGSETDDHAIEMSESAMKLAEVRTSVVGKEKPLKEINLYGKIAPDERLLQSQTAHFPGRIEQLMVNVTGEAIRTGQVIARIYSPELVTAQKELLEAVSLGSQYPAILNASREKLRLWKLTEDQIESIEKSNKVITTFDMLANSSGIVLNRKVNTGDYVTTGDVLFDVADLSRIWALFDAYETDIPWLSADQVLNFTTEAIPGKTFYGKISFIDPFIDPVKRIAKVRVEVVNRDLKLKPEMFINGIVESNLKTSGEQIIIPQSAVLWTGTRSIVYVKIPDTRAPSFKIREIALGPSLKESYIVLSGLTAGEEIVTNGAFSVDAASQLAGKPSMMNQEENMPLPKSGNKEMSVKKISVMQHKHDKMPEAISRTSSGRAQFFVRGNCDMCRERIEAAAVSVAGMVKATWNADTRMLDLTYDQSKTNMEAVHKSIALAGHDTEKEKAPDEVYHALPECCLYRK
jgi:Cu(I)/Ag(I) efflux system membrane fusion protein